CLARDRTKHQVAEVTSLGLVQMTRKRVGSGLLEAFSVPCEHCNGRGVITSLEPVDHTHGRDSGGRDSGRQDSGSQAGAGKGGRGRSGSRAGRSASPTHPSPAAIPGSTASGSRQDVGGEGAPGQDRAGQGISTPDSAGQLDRSGAVAVADLGGATAPDGTG